MIRIIDWAKLQHYSDRRPPWIKLHTDMLEERRWHALSGDAAKLLMDLFILATHQHAEKGTPGTGEIPHDLDELTWKLRRSSASKVLALCTELERAGYIETQGLGDRSQADIFPDTLPDGPKPKGRNNLPDKKKSEASNGLAEFSPEGEGEGEAETDNIITFENFWTTYPRKIGKAAARKAWKARINADVNPREIMDGLRRYVAMLQAQGTAAHFIKHPSTFLGPDEWWKEPYPIPESPVKAKREEEDQSVREIQKRFEGKKPDIRERPKTNGDPSKISDLLPGALPPKPKDEEETDGQQTKG